MKVLLKQNVRKLGIIGDIVDVKSGYARNYLVPQGLGTAPTEQAIKDVEAAKAAYLAKVAKDRAEIKARAKTIDGQKITLVARANEEGHLYGSIGPAQIAHAMEEIGVPVAPEEVIMSDTIHQLDKYDVNIELADGISATIAVWVVPIREEGDDTDSFAAAMGETETAEQDADDSDDSTL
jgi:large subunit ribosomal protein L9